MPYFSDQAAQFQALAQCIQNQLTMQGGAMDEATYGGWRTSATFYWTRQQR